MHARTSDSCGRYGRKRASIRRSSTRRVTVGRSGLYILDHIMWTGEPPSITPVGTRSVGASSRRAAYLKPNEHLPGGRVGTQDIHQGAGCVFETRDVRGRGDDRSVANQRQYLGQELAQTRAVIGSR